MNPSTTPEQNALANRLDDWLPQTQCGRCGYPRCRLYAEALVRGEADVNQCPPGGEVSIHALAALLNVSPKPLDPAFGAHEPRKLARIDEATCIGCTLCIQACPVDAILGAAQQMHTVIADECTGCELCVPACPVDCITLIPVTLESSANDWRWPQYAPAQVARARRRCEARLQRLQARAGRGAWIAAVPAISTEDIRREIAAAVARVRAKKAKQSPLSRPVR
jgi:electron transport complex protein RnfB